MLIKAEKQFGKRNARVSLALMLIKAEKQFGKRNARVSI